MIIATNKKIAGVYAETIFDTLLKGASKENTKKISETLGMLFQAGEPGDMRNELYFRLFDMWDMARKCLYDNTVLDMDNDEFIEHLNWLVEHQND